MENYKDVMELLRAMDKKLDIHIALDVKKEAEVSEHDRILKGANGDIGLIDQVRKNTEFNATLKKVMWIVVTPLLLLISSGVIVLLMQGAQAQ